VYASSLAQVFCTCGKKHYKICKDIVKKEEGRRKREEGRGKKEEGRRHTQQAF
jgi:hypothetical protein